jgi:hypothetical protein
MAAVSVAGSWVGSSKSLLRVMAVPTWAWARVTGPTGTKIFLLRREKGMTEIKPIIWYSTVELG